MEQIIFPLVIVYHTTCLRLDRDASLSLHIQLVQDLLILASFNCPCQFQQTIAERALPMIDVGDDTEVPKAVDGDV